MNELLWSVTLRSVDIITCGVSFLIMLYPIFRSYRKKAAVGRRRVASRY